MQLRFWVKSHMDFLVVGTGTACNLRCRDCGNFIPHIRQTLYDLDAVAYDVSRLARFIKIGMIQLQGGEALLHPDLHHLVSKLVRGRFAGKVQIATNGMRLMSPKLAAACREGGVTLRISNYNLGADKVVALQEQCTQEKVGCRTYSFAAGDDTWHQLGGIAMEKDTDDDRVRSRFERCPFRACFTLEDGILGRCSRAVLSHVAGQHPLDSQSVLEVRKTEPLKKDLRRYLAEKRFMMSCRYCHGADGDKIAPAIQIAQGGV